MDAKQEAEYRKQFKEILFDLAKSQDKLKPETYRSHIYLKLEELYWKTDFRHYYSDVFSVLTSLQQDDTLGSIDTLGQNMNIIAHGYQAKNTDSEGTLIDISNQIKKLYDHVSLDIARILYSDAADRKVLQNESIDKLKSEINRLRIEVDSYENRYRESQEAIAQTQGKIADSENAIKETQTKIEQSEKQYVAILGIFASIVLTVIAGITFSTSVLENIHKGSIYRIVFVCLSIGLVLLDILYFLYTFILRIVKNTKKDSKKGIIIINAVLFLLMVLVFLCWKTGFVENRDAGITNDDASSIVETQPYTDNSTQDMH